MFLGGFPRLSYHVGFWVSESLITQAREGIFFNNSSFHSFTAPSLTIIVHESLANGVIYVYSSPIPSSKSTMSPRQLQDPPIFFNTSFIFPNTPFAFPAIQSTSIIHAGRNSGVRMQRRLLHVECGKLATNSKLKRSNLDEGLCNRKC